jgi:PAS domain S-box-containing protein
MGEARAQAGWERLFWLVFERTSNPVVLLDEKRTIVEVNDAAVELIGGSRASLIGSSIVASIDPDEREAAGAEWDAFLSSGEYTGTRDLLRADGSRVHVQFAARLAVVGARKLAIYVAMPDDAGDALVALDAQLPLTAREREVVTLIALGHETDDIARELHISPETVRSHVRNAMARLGAHTRAQLVAIAICGEQALHRGLLEG